MVEAAEGLRLRAAAYSGLRLPTLNELYRPFVVFPVTTQANAALRNERLEGFEAGIDWQALDGLRRESPEVNKLMHWLTSCIDKGRADAYRDDA